MIWIFLLIFKLLGFGIAIGVGLHLLMALVESIVIFFVAYIIAGKFDKTRDFAFPIALGLVFLPNICGYIGESLSSLEIGEAFAQVGAEERERQFIDVDGERFAAQPPLSAEAYGGKIIDNWRERRKNPEHKPVFPVIYSIRTSIGNFFASIFSFGGALLRFPSFLMGLVTFFEVMIPLALVLGVWLVAYRISKKHGGARG